MNYTSLRNMPTATCARIIEGLRSLRAGFDNLVPRKGPGSLLLATWNIREFGGTKYGGRSKESYFYIAECLNHFDLIAVQEVRRDLGALREVMRLLGPQWDVVFTDVSYAEGGNSERLAFLFDKNQTFFTGLAGELVVPKREAKEMSQIARTPFICGFQAGWAKFNLCTVHIYYGTGDQNPRRVREINWLARLLATKAKDYIKIEDQLSYSPENLIILGDFNIAKHTHKTFTALTDNGFIIPETLQKLPGSNVTKDKFYDQIAFFKEAKDITSAKAGIFDFYEHVYKDEGRYKSALGETKARSFRDWRTYQMSDHLIMWAQFNVDKTDAYFDNVAKGDASSAVTGKPGETSAKKKRPSTAKKKKKAVRRKTRL